MKLELKYLKLSKKIKTYIKKAEEETNREVYIKGVEDVGMPGTSARFIANCNSKNIYVEIIELFYRDEKGNLKQEQEEIDNIIAHEVTHGRLAYKEKYCQLRLIGNNYNLIESIGLLASRIEDIVVNTIIKENSFRPISQRFFTIIESATKDMQKGKDIYERFNYSPILRKCFMLSTYIEPWGYLQYFNLDLNSINKRNLHKFLKIFQKSYPDQFNEAEKIIKIISENDIFTPEGFCNTIKKCLDLDLLNLIDLVELYTC
jgi:hypothetical protein